MASIEITNSDILEWCKSYGGPKFHALLTDCPYEYGFMGKSWDSSGVSFQPDTWAALGEHLYPGAFGMTYGGPRTWHRIAVAIEDAGFVIHPTIFAWIYSSGFPKSTRIDKKLDQMAGAEREVIGFMAHPASEIFQGGKLDRKVEVTAAATELAKAWVGHRYGLQALKPAVEPIILFQKPYDGKAVESIAEYGAGALWVDGARVGDGSERTPGGKGSASTPFISPANPKRYERPVGGLWPANLIISHHPSCNNKECHENCNVASLGGDEKFFSQTNFLAEVIEHEAIIYASKPNDKERFAGTDATVDHVTLKPISVNKHLATILLPPDHYSPRRLLVPFSGVASEVIGGLLAGWEHIHGIEILEEHVAASLQRSKWWADFASVYGNDIDKILSFAGIINDDNQMRMNI